MTLTPYDTGARLQPVPWHVQPLNLTKGVGEEDRYGRVDFDNDESVTVATVCIENTPEGYVLHVRHGGDVTIKEEKV